MEKPLLLIVGRTSSGKDTLAQALCKNGLSQVLSYTTRPRRAGEGNTHIFIAPEQIDNYANKMTCTTINNHYYFTTSEILAKHDIYIIDPIGVNTLLRNPNFARPYVILYLNETYNIRKQRFMARDGSSLQEFLSREHAETQQFTDFEHYIDNHIQNNTHDIHNNKIYQFCECETNDIVSFIMNQEWYQTNR